MVYMPDKGLKAEYLIGKKSVCSIGKFEGHIWSLEGCYPPKRSLWSDTFKLTRF